MLQTCVRLTYRTGSRLQQPHLHTLLVHSVIAAQLQEVVSFLDEPLAEVASLPLHHSIVTDWVIFVLDLPVHLLDLRCRELLLLLIYCLLALLRRFSD